VSVTQYYMCNVACTCHGQIRRKTPTIFVNKDIIRQYKK
jgi:hypothetical protein